MPPRERPCRSHRGDTDPISELAIHPSGTLVFSAVKQNIKVFEFETRELVMVLPYETRALREFVVTPEGWLLALGWNGIHGWELATGAERNVSAPLGHPRGCVFTPDGESRLLTSSDNVCTVWDLSTFEPLLTLPHDAATIRVATLSKSGDRVVSIDSNDVLYTWDARTGARLSTWPRTTYCDRSLPMVQAQIDPEGRWVLSTTLVDMSSWDVEQGKRQWHVGGPSPNISFFSLAKGGRFALMQGHNGGLERWDLVTGQRLTSLPGVRPREVLAAFGPDERTVVLCHEYGSGFEVVDLETGSPVASSTQRTTFPIHRLLVHPDGQTLLTAGKEEPILLWDMKTGAPTGRLGDSPGQGALDGDPIDPNERLIYDFMEALDAKHIGFRSAARAGDGDGEEYRDEARWIQLYFNEVRAIEITPGERREEVLDRLYALAEEVRGYGAWMARRDVKEIITELRKRP